MDKVIHNLLITMVIIIRFNIYCGNKCGKVDNETDILKNG